MLLLEKEISIKKKRENKIILISLKDENNLIFENLLNESVEFYKRVFNESRNLKNITQTEEIGLIPELKIDLKKYV